MASAAQSASGSRSRTQSRKKVNDDAAYFGPITAAAGPSGTKRQAPEKADGEQPRIKRKRVEGSNTGATNKKDAVDVEPRKSLVEFSRLSTATLHRYLTQYDIVPKVYPSPLSAEDPPAPSSLADPAMQHQRPPSPLMLTPANRPRRDRESHNRRRSSRLLEEETRQRTPILCDVAELHGVLAGIVERHFREAIAINGREEVDTLASFMCAVEKSKNERARGG